MIFGLFRCLLTFWGDRRVRRWYLEEPYSVTMSSNPVPGRAWTRGLLGEILKGAGSPCLENVENGCKM